VYINPVDVKTIECLPPAAASIIDAGSKIGYGYLGSFFRPLLRMSPPFFGLLAITIFLGVERFPKSPCPHSPKLPFPKE
jgi:hypothetical protein